MTDSATADPAPPRSAAPAARKPFYADLTFQVLAGLFAGVALGVLSPGFAQLLKPLGDAFIRLIQMVVGLIIFCTVVHGIASVRDLGKVGRVAIKALIYFEVVTSLALVIGLVTINLLHPGTGMHIDPHALKAGAVSGYAAEAKQTNDFGDFLLNLIPTSAVGAFAKGDILQILVFSRAVRLRAGHSGRARGTGAAGHRGGLRRAVPRHRLGDEAGAHRRLRGHGLHRGQVRPGLAGLA